MWLPDAWPLSGPSPRSAESLSGAPGDAPSGPARVAPGHDRGAARRIPVGAALARMTFKFSLISFKFTFIYVLRRALRRVTIHFKFRFISVLRRTLRRATIHFNFILV
jgi:hypothetical protein